MSALFRVTRTADFDRLYRDHAASVYRYAFAVLGNHADAEDVTQQTFLNAYRAMARGTKPRKAENWLLTIVHNEVRRHFRSTHRKPFEVELDEELPQQVPERSEPSVADILRALQHLPPAQRSALVMREFEGRSYSEMAEILDVTQSALETLLFRARRALAEQLDGTLTCAEAEQAVSRHLDGRLPRREARRLKAHLRECPLCTRFADVQKRQSSLLGGLSVIPIPASLFLFRGEQAAAAGLGACAVAAGGSTAAGGGAAAGGAGLAAGLVAKAAAVTAAVGVAGGVSYGVAARPDAVTKSERQAAQAAAVAETRHGGRAADVRLARARGARPSLARPAIVHRQMKNKNRATEARRARPPSQAKAHGVRAKAPAAALARAHPQAPPAAKARTTKPKPTPPRTRARPTVGNRLGHVRPVRQKRTRPTRIAKKAARSSVPPLPKDVGRGRKS